MVINRFFCHTIVEFGHRTASDDNCIGGGGGGGGVGGPDYY